MTRTGLPTSRRFALPSVCLLIVLLSLAPTCGVSFGGGEFEGNELLKGIDVTGDMVPGGALQVVLDVNQAYPVPVRIACYYEDGDRLNSDQLKLAFEERAIKVGEVVLPAATDHQPKEKVTKQTLRIPFSVDEEGSYYLVCLPPAAPEAGWGLGFSIEPPSGSSSSRP